MGSRVLLAAAVLSPPLLAQGDGTFEFPLRIGGVPNPVCVAAGDFNRDGKLDLAAASGTARITVVYQDPLNRLNWKPLTPAPAVGVGCFFLRAGDLDGDGGADLAIADPGSSAHVLRSKADGTFEAALALRQSPGSRWVAVADFNGDGRSDLASANWTLGTVTVYLGQEDGTLRFSRSYQLGGEPHAIEPFDYDGDGKVDLAVGLDVTGTALLKGRGDGQFDRKLSVAPFSGCHRYLATGDFNRDGLGDMVTSCGVGISQGNGTFKRAPGVGGFFGAGVAADLDGDGAEDVAFPSPAADRRVVVHPGLGTGEFLPAVSLRPTGDAPSFLAAADLDGDGFTDLVSADTGSSSLTLFWGRPRDFPGVGRSLTGLLGAKALAVGDIDRDGAPDLVVPSSTQPRLSIFLNPGRTSFSTPTLAVPTANIFHSIEAADLDGDGGPDLAGAGFTAGTALVILLDPRGAIRKEVALPAGSLPAAVAVARLDEDTAADLAFPCFGSNDIAVFLGRGEGSFSEARRTASIEKLKDLAAGDLDGDGRADLAVIATREVAVHHGVGGGALAEPLLLAQEATANFTDLAIADATGDGRNDLLVADYLTSTLSIHASSGARAFEAPRKFRAGVRNPSTFIALDLQGDGLPDLAVSTASGAAQAISVFLNRGAAGFDPPTAYQIGLAPVGMRAADIDLDGALDIVAFSSSIAMILHGHRAASPAAGFRRGDVDQDGRIQVNDPIAILGRLFLGADPLACEDAADADDDGDLGLADPIVVLQMLFLGGAPLPPPGPKDCGEDRTPDSLAGCRGGC